MKEETVGYNLYKNFEKRAIHSEIYCAKCGDEMLRFRHPPATDYDPQIHGDLDENGWQTSKLICLACGHAEIKREAAKKVAADYLAKSKYGKYDILKKRSLLGRKSLWFARFDTFKVDNTAEQIVLNAARRIAQDYISGSRFNTVLTGDAGRGKSHLAMAILHEVNEMLKESKFSCLFINSSELIREIKASWNYEDTKDVEERLITLMREVDLLVIDDLGTESTFSKDNSWVQSIIYNVLNARETNTIVTTNLQGGDMKSTYDNKIISRIMENAKNSIVKFDGISDKRRQR